MIDKRIKRIHIASEWSKSPTGRYARDGVSNGTAFQKKFLLDDLDKIDEFHIDLDGTEGYGSSFLDEAFAGLIRKKLLTAQEFNSRFIFTSKEDPGFIEEIQEYVDEAAQE